MRHANAGEEKNEKKNTKNIKKLIKQYNIYILYLMENHIMKKYEEYLYLQKHPIGSNSDLFVL